MAKVLIVDDEEILRDLVSDTLSMGGHECVVASDPVAGLAKIDLFDPDLVISDYKMPGMTGIDFLKQVQKSRPGQAFLLMTALVATHKQV